ncbi:MAG: histidine phosphatase family protein [Candidatus Saccharimonadales bacterium]
MRITAVRHGETLENAAMVVQGQSRGTLSPEGIQQIQKLGERLAGDSFDICYSSDLERCRDTAGAILLRQPDLQVVYDERLRERSMKPEEGKLFKDIDWDWADDRKLDHKTKEGESWIQVIERVADFLNDTYDRHTDDHILVVSHGGPLRAMIALLLGGGWDVVGRTSINNCETLEWTMEASVDAAAVRSQ